MIDNLNLFGMQQHGEWIYAECPKYAEQISEYIWLNFFGQIWIFSKKYGNGKWDEHKVWHRLANLICVVPASYFLNNSNIIWTAYCKLYTSCNMSQQV